MMFWLVVAILVFAAMILGFGIAVVALRLRNDRRARERAALEARWEAAILDVMGGTLTPATLHPLVRPSDEWFFIGVLTRYARRLRGPERERLAELAAPYLPRVAARLKHPWEDVRARAVQALSLVGLPQWTDVVAGALRDPSPIVAMAAARGLARPDHPEYAVPIVAELHRFAAWDRSFVVGMLARVGPPLAPPLMEALADPSRPVIARIMAADGLRALNHLEAGDVAARALDRAEPELAAACLRLLRQIGRPSHLPAVLPYLEAPDYFMRAGAIAAASALAASADVQRLVTPALDDPSPWVVLEAARALASVAPAALRAIGAGEGPRAAAAREALAEAVA